MALTLSNLGSTQNKTSEASTSTSSLTASVGDMLVVVIAANNAGTSGASAISSVSDSAGNTYTQRTLVNNTPGSAVNDGCTHAIYTSVLTSALSAGSVTVNFSPNVTAKAIVIYRVQPGAGETPTYRSAGSGFSGAASSASDTATSVTNGDTVIFGIAIERPETVTGDSDTSNGSWSTAYQNATSGGGAVTNMTVAAQYKTVSATANQTWDPSWGTSADHAGNWIRIYPASTAKTITAGGGSYSLTGTAATPKHGWLIAAGSGSYAVTGTAATIKHAWVTSASAGTYSVSGTAAATLHGWRVTAGGGSYAVSGTDAGIYHGWLLAASGGSYAVSGSDASPLLGRLLTADGGSYVITGTDAELTLTVAPAQETLGGSWYPRPIKYIRNVPDRVQDEEPAPPEEPFDRDEFAAIAQGLIEADIAAIIRQIQDAALSAEAQIAAREAGQRYIEQMQRDEDDALLALLLAA